VKRQETTERILDTAMELMGEKGYESFTIARLAQEMGYAVGALYRYFKGKDAILVALEKRVLDRLFEDQVNAEERTEAHLARAKKLDAKDTALLHVLVAAETYASLVTRRPLDHQLLAMTLADPRELLEEELMTQDVMPSLLRPVNQLTAKLEAAAKAKAIDKGAHERRTLAIWVAVQGHMMLRKLGRVEPMLASRKLFDEVATTLLVGWGADEKKVRAMLPRAHKIVDRL